MHTSKQILVLKVGTFISMVTVFLLFTSCNLPVMMRLNNSFDPQSATYQATPQPGNYNSPYIGELKLVPSGKFQRGVSSLDISQVSDFHMGTTEITRGQFLAVYGSDPSYTAVSPNQTDPVQSISWYQTIVFCNKLSLLEGLTPVYTISSSTNPVTWGAVPNIVSPTWDAVTADWNANGYRLPTETEWIWAAMGATADASAIMVSGVNTSGYNKAFAGQEASTLIANYAWLGISIAHTVGTKTANELGIYDMSGNVFEWNWDWFQSNIGGYLIDYPGPASGTNRKYHGFCFSSSPGSAPIANSSDVLPYVGSNDKGFRVVRK